MGRLFVRKAEPVIKMRGARQVILEINRNKLMTPKDNRS